MTPGHEPKEMRILFFTQQWAASRSGVGTYARALVEALVERGHGLTVVAPEEEAFPAAGVRFVHASRARWDPNPGGWFTLGRSFAGVLRREGATHDVALFADAREARAV